jgi:isoleucyl-tRNA synthetase
LEIFDNEAEYISYNTEPDHREIGSVLKKTYTKELKERLSKLTREETLSYLKDGKVTINGIEFLEGWLKITKVFNEGYQKSTEYAVGSSIDVSVMLATTMTESLKVMGTSREIVNKV